ncbi:hypothetical protein ACWGNE_13250 [Streptomyces xiamenensis]
MPGYEQLYGLKLTHLESAAGDWSTLAGRLGELAEEAERDFLTKVEPLDWRGETADMAKPFLTLTGQRFRYAHETALSVHEVLNGLLDAQRQARNDLLAVETEAADLSLGIHSDGTVYSRLNGAYADEELERMERWTGSHRSSPGQAQQADVDYIVRRIEEVLARSAEADATASRALGDLAGEAGEGFGVPPLTGMESAARMQGLEDASELAGLYRSGEYLTQEGLERATEILTAQRDNEHFAVHFTTTLGADGVLDFWSNLVLVDPYREPTQEYLRSVEEAREALGATLGTATRAGGARMETWQADVLDQLDRIHGPENGGALLGAQIMSDLMRHGEWDTDYLTAYGDRLIAIEQPSGDGARWVPPTTSTLPGLEFRYDPATGFMRALDNNPDASYAFFSSTEPTDTTAYFLEERSYAPNLSEETETGRSAARDAVMDALLAATSGRSSDEPAPLSPEHSAEQLRLFRHVMDVSAGTGNDFDADFREGMARLLGEYRAEVFDTASNHSGSQLPLDPGHLSQLSNQVSRSPESYAILHMTMAAEYAERISSDTTGDANFALGSVGRAIGFLENGRFHAIEISDDSVWTDRWTYRSIGNMAAKIPVAGGLLGASIEAIGGQWLKWSGANGDDEDMEYRSDYYERENVFINELANQWLSRNPDASGNLTPEEARTAAEQIVRDAADHGHTGAVAVLGGATW